VQKNRLALLALTALAAVLVASIGAAVRGGAAWAAPQATFKACLVTDIGGLNDKSFNHLAYVGLTRAQTKLNVQTRVIQSKSPQDYIPNLSTCARQGYGVTIAVGFLMTDAMDAVATRFPKSKFAIVDVNISDLKHHPKNVQGLLFREQEAGYLVGYLAAAVQLRFHMGQAVGAVGGIKIPPVDRYIAGYVAGAKKANPKVKFFNAYSQDFVDQAKCKEAALDEIAKGATVIFQVAGQCGLGALDAAKEKQLYGIGVDADQGFLGQHVLTSALKKVDVAVYSAIAAAKVGKLNTNTNAIFTVKNGGIGTGRIATRVPKDLIAQLNSIRNKIRDGVIKNIPSTIK
jgi:basic membrane protein A